MEAWFHAKLVLMELDLDPAEVRVLGVLLEKDMATPEYYPLSLNALTNACNQKTNRDPVVSYDETTVTEAITHLRQRRLAHASTDSRVPKYAHWFSEAFNLGRGEMAMLAVLLLRGPQTLGELRERTQRMHDFADMDSAESCLRHLEEREPQPLVKKFRQPGWKEARYMHLFAGDVVVSQTTPEPPQDRIGRLEAEIAALRDEVADLRNQFVEFRKQFE